MSFDWGDRHPQAASLAPSAVNPGANGTLYPPNGGATSRKYRTEDLPQARGTSAREPSSMLRCNKENA
jgi:hypothetical protein